MIDLNWYANTAQQYFYNSHNHNLVVGLCERLEQDQQLYPVDFALRVKAIRDILFQAFKSVIFDQNPSTTSIRNQVPIHLIAAIGALPTERSRRFIATLIAYKVSNIPIRIYDIYFEPSLLPLTQVLSPARMQALGLTVPHAHVALPVGLPGQPLLFDRDDINNRFNSMRPPTAEQSRGLDRVQQHYAAKLAASGGVKGVLNQLREFLRIKFMAEQPSILVAGQPVPLPFEWLELQALKENLLRNNYESGLKEYYKNPFHNAYRSILHGNPWAKRSAAYLNSFETHKPLIADLWLAASDPTEPGTDGITIQDRQMLFVVELGYLVRANNWKSRPIFRNGAAVMRLNNWGQPEHATEDHDNLEADDPACIPGYRRRLAQSVQGHRLLIGVLTPDHVLTELKSFVRNYYQELFATKSLAILAEIRTTTNAVLVDMNMDLLPAVPNVTAEKRSQFIQEMQARFPHIENNAAVIQQVVTQQLDLNLSNYFNMHYFKFYEMSNLSDILNTRIARLEQQPAPALRM